VLGKLKEGTGEKKNIWFKTETQAQRASGKESRFESKRKTPPNFVEGKEGAKHTKGGGGGLFSKVKEGGVPPKVTGTVKNRLEHKKGLGSSSSGAPKKGRIAAWRLRGKQGTRQISVGEKGRG